MEQSKKHPVLGLLHLGRNVALQCLLSGLAIFQQTVKGVIGKRCQELSYCIVVVLDAFGTFERFALLGPTPLV